VLILSRRIGEVLCIGADITVTVIDIQRGQIRLGISAPSSVSVDRSEIRDRKDAERLREGKKRCQL
jgi:carbon storage regulator